MIIKERVMMMVEYISLNGQWDAALRPSGLRTEEAVPNKKWDFNHELSVPGYWQESLSMPQGMVIYRRAFRFTKKNTTYFLQIGAVDYQAEIWLNDIYVGVMESEYSTFLCNVTDYLVEGENTLIVFVSSFLPEYCERKDSVKGANLHWDCVPCRQGPIHDDLVPSSSSHRYPSPGLATGGIIGEVYLMGFSQAVITHMQILSLLRENLDEGSLYLRVHLYNPKGVERLPLRFLVEPKDFLTQTYTFKREADILPGNNILMFHLPVENPVLWWPKDMGEQNLYTIRAFHREDSHKQNSTSLCTGFRRISKDDRWGLYVNGERFFARGFNYMASVFHYTQSEEVFCRDIELMLEAHANMVRVFGHVTHPVFYEHCDSAGLLVFQDLPFQWGYENSPSFLRLAREVTEGIVLRYMHHPSIFLWCLHSESRYMDFNKLDQITEMVVRSLDPTRPIIKNSVLAWEGEQPSSILDFSYFTHCTEKQIQKLSVCWTGWYWNKVEDIGRYNPLFVTEFGTQSLPESPSFLSEIHLVEDLIKVGFQPMVYLQATDSHPTSMEELACHSQEYQARYYEYHIEELRLKKYKNCNGLLVFHLVSTYPSADWSILDYQRSPKKAYGVIKEKFQPLLPVAVIKKIWHPLSQVDLEIWSINDLSHRVICEKVVLILKDPDGVLLLNIQKEGRELQPNTAESIMCLSLPSAPLLQASSLEISFKTSLGDFTNTNYYRILEEIQLEGGARVAGKNTVS